MTARVALPERLRLPGIRVEKRRGSRAAATSRTSSRQRRGVDRPVRDGVQGPRRHLARVNRSADPPRLRMDQTHQCGRAKPPTKRKSYFTMSEENNYTIWSFLKKCHGRGHLSRLRLDAVVRPVWRRHLRDGDEGGVQVVEHKAASFASRLGVARRKPAV